MTITNNQFKRACTDFKRYAKETIKVSFSKGTFWISGNETTLKNLIKVYRNSEAAFMQDGKFVLRTSFNGAIEEVTV